MEETRVNQQINDVTNDNLKKLEQLFPSVVKDGRVDFDALKAELGEVEEVGAEKFELVWAGKANAKKISREDIVGRTLKYIPDDGKNIETTENLYIEGDNLEVLKLLRQNYYGAIKMIYIDPPYNTGNDFIYNDSFVMSKEDDDKASGTVGDDGERYAINKSSQNRYHANWLNMMYPRLKIARELLTDDGVIFISIDENEVNTLKAICDEIFGADNFIAELIWAAGRKNDSKYISVSHEYILAYFRDMQYIIENKIVWREKKQGLDDIYAKYESLKKEYGTDYKAMEKALKSWYKGLPDGHPAKDHSHYSRIDANGIFFPDNISWPGGGGPKYDLLHPITHKPVKVPSRGWLTNEQTMKEWIAQGRVEFGDDENNVPTLKSYLKDRETTVPYSVFYKDGRASSKRLATLLGDKVFENPKDEEIIQRLIEFCGTDDNDTILDFFSGSATTAHALFLANANQKKNRKFILVQYPEDIDSAKVAAGSARKVAENAEALLDSISAPHNLCEIGKERIRRAGESVLQDNPDCNVDVGFKVFRVADTNIKWNSLITNGQLDFTQIESTPDMMDFMPGTNDIDVVYEIMLRQRDVPLSEKIEKLSNIGNRTYLYADAYLICLESELTTEMIDKMAAIDPVPVKYVFRDSAFKDDIALKDETFRRLKAVIEKNTNQAKQTYTVEFI